MADMAEEGEGEEGEGEEEEARGWAPIPLEVVLSRVHHQDHHRHCFINGGQTGVTGTFSKSTVFSVISVFISSSIRKAGGRRTGRKKTDLKLH